MTVLVRRFYPALGIPQFRTLWLATLPALFAFHFGLVASGYAAVRLSDTAAVVGLVGGAWGLPLLIVPLFGGVAADRLSRRRIMIASQAILAVSTLLVAAQAYQGSLSVLHIVLLGLTQGTAFAFATPARVAYAAETVGKSLMPSAIATHYASLTLTSIMGPAIAGALLAVPMFGISGTYAVVAALYAFGVVGLSRLPEIPSTGSGADVNLRGRLLEGIRYVASTRPLPHLLAIAATVAFLGMPYIPLMPLYADRVFETGATGLGLLLAASGVGSFVGAAVSGAASQRGRLGLALPSLGLAFGGALVGLAASPTFEIALLSAFLVGLSGSTLAIVTNSLVIASSTPEFFGRVWSINQLTFGLGPLGAIGIGAVSDVLGPRSATAIAGVTLAVVVGVLAVGVRQTTPVGD
jgi:MFS family permease